MARATYQSSSERVGGYTSRGADSEAMLMETPDYRRCTNADGNWSSHPSGLCRACRAEVKAKAVKAKAPAGCVTCGQPRYCGSVYCQACIDSAQGFRMAVERERVNRMRAKDAALPRTIPAQPPNRTIRADGREFLVVWDGT